MKRLPLHRPQPREQRRIEGDAVFPGRAGILHVRRTTRPDGTRDPIGPLRGYRSTGREDDYVDPYFGREYPGPGWPDGPMEVMTRTYEMVFTSTLGGVRKLIQKDPELLDFALGALFRFDPR